MRTAEATTFDSLGRLIKKMGLFRNNGLRIPSPVLFTSASAEALHARWLPPAAVGTLRRRAIRFSKRGILPARG